MGPDQSFKPLSFEVFKGATDLKGKIRPVRRVGKCLFFQNSGLHVIHIDVMPGAQNAYYLLPNPEGSFNICLKEIRADGLGKHFFRIVGTACLCDGPNEGLLYLEWDFIGPNGIYMRTITNETKLEAISA